MILILLPQIIFQLSLGLFWDREHLDSAYYIFTRLLHILSGGTHAVKVFPVNNISVAIKPPNDQVIKEFLSSSSAS